MLVKPLLSFRLPFKQLRLEGEPVLCGQSPGQRRQVNIDAHSQKQSPCVLSSAIRTAVGATVRIGEIAEAGNCWPTLQIAAMTNWLNVQRLVVIPMVVVFGARAAIDTFMRMNRSKTTVRNCPINQPDSVRSAVADTVVRTLKTGIPTRGTDKLVISAPSQFEFAAVTAFEPRKSAGLAPTLNLIHLRHHPGFFGLAIRRPARVRLRIVTRRDDLKAIPPDIRAQFGKREARVQFHNQFAELVSGLALAARAVIKVVNVHPELFGERFALRWLGLQKIGAKVHLATGQCLDHGFMIDQKGLRSKPFWMFINLFRAGNVGV